MPRPPRICSCGRVVPFGMKCECRKALERARPTAPERGYDGRWKKASRAFLLSHQVCACGCGAPATEVDHIVPHRGDLRLFWDTSNWQGLAKQCHSRKTLAENRGNHVR
jgi:5-methylcytosine-specific restriction enzyme A